VKDHRKKAKEGRLELTSSFPALDLPAVAARAHDTVASSARRKLILLTRMTVEPE